VDVPTLDIRVVGDLACDEGALGQITVSDDGEYVAVAGCNNKVAVLSATLQKVLWIHQAYRDDLRYVVFSSGGLTLYTGGRPAAFVYAIETKTGKVTAQWAATTTGKPIYGHRMSCLAVSPDDRWVAAGTAPEGQVYLFDVTGKEKPRMLLHGLTTTAIVSFSPDSLYLASFAGGKIKIWSVAPAPRKPVEAP
jgi:WD40 repeat protein